jgi:hypothetical protein
MDHAGLPRPNCETEWINNSHSANNDEKCPETQQFSGWDLDGLEKLDDSGLPWDTGGSVG